MSIYKFFITFLIVLFLNLNINLSNSYSFTENKIKISIWDFPRISLPNKPNDRFLWLKNICDEFEKNNPNVKIEITKLTWSQGKEKIKIAVFSNVLPDIFSSDFPLEYVKNNLIEPIDDYLTSEDYNDYFDFTLNAFKYNEKIYGFPWAQKTDYLFLNKKIFKMANVNLPINGIWTIEEFYNKMKTIKQTLKNIYPFKISIDRDQTTDLPFIFNDENSYLNFENTLNKIKFLYDLVYVDHILPLETGGLKPKDIWIDFYENQKVAVAPFGIWAIPKLLQDKNFEFDIAQFPYISKNNPMSYSTVIGYFVFKQNDPIKRDVCIKLAKFITNSHNQKILKHYGQFPTRISASNIYDNNLIMKKAFELLKFSKTLPNIQNYSKIDEQIKITCQKILLTPNLSTNEIQIQLKNTKNNINEIIKQQLITNPTNSNSIFFIKNIFKICILILIVCLIYIFHTKKLLNLIINDIYFNMWTYLFLLPALLVFLFFFILPALYGIAISFHNYAISNEGFQKFCGFDNYINVLKDKLFLKSLLNTLIYVIMVVPTNIIIALILAVLIYRLSEKWQLIFKGAFYLPAVISIVTLSIIWRYIFDFNIGILNLILKSLSLEPIGWLTSEKMSLYSIILFTILKGPGGALLIYLSALCNISRDYYEAAKIDGANELITFLYITIPLLKPQTMFLLISLTIDSMQVFAPVMLLTEGGPSGSSEVAMYRIYKEAFSNLNLGNASAMSMILFFIILCFSILQYKYFKFEN